MTEHMSSEPGTKPNPDPTVATNDAVERAVKAERDYVDGEVKVIEEKFASVTTQFALANEQRVEQKKDTKDAVDAALAAAKEAVGKSEVSTKEQLNAMRTEMGASINSVSDALGDLKERVVTLESVKRGAHEQRAQSREGVTFAQGLIATAVILLMVVLNVVGIAYSRANSQAVPPDPVVVTVTQP